ncbi:hypothetical protein [Trichormus variabilis]|uniref:Uncharacterized protein n=1 Tax=Trichormus variabilis SAG 1403-4b TaxID=447716 RepID=A0A3S1CHE9_ANAVA|nr:hypothetical protein [Trichormus variabilis]MBD2629897.1 hypothetical protein [Trichormus variabilis FACHB-164]RUS92529.1 hypothetical protein DSM107003_50120 [Trichormus variabilis SAG 1403-4b]
MDKASDWGGTDGVVGFQPESQVDRGAEGLGQAVEARFKLGQRATWKDAPSWWNPLSEEIYEIGDGWVRLNYGGRKIPFCEVILISPLS